MYSLFVNHKYADEAGSVIRLFFPGAKITIGAQLEDLHFVSELRQNHAYAEVSKKGVVLSSYKWPFSNVYGFLTFPRKLMLALFHALQKIKPTHTPWGALTGIRPTKLVRQWQSLGISDEEAINILQDPYCVSKTKAELALEVAKTENLIAKKIFDMSIKSIGFYVNIPFCASRCHYCSFSCMDVPPSDELQETYVNVLVSEIIEKAEQIKNMGEVVTSIYIGGGTPTFLHEASLLKIMTALEEIKSEKTTEFTVEGGRPDSVTKEKMALLVKHGVTRFCVNPQTLNDNTLTTIGRNHTSEDFFRAFDVVRDAGIKNISVDIIAGLPGESPSDMERTIKGVTGLEPENITVHNLAIKRASRLKLGKPEVSMPNASTAYDMLTTAQEYVRQANYKPYYLYRQKDMIGLSENVGYCKHGHWCLYNVGMMSEVQTIIAAGAGAVSKYITGSKITREFNVKNPEVYVKRGLLKINTVINFPSHGTSAISSVY